MKKFKDLSTKQLKMIIESSEELRHDFELYIQDCEMDYMYEKLEKIERSLTNWCIDAYAENFISVKDYSLFIDCLEDYERCFGLSSDVLSLLDWCKRLENCNLFKYHAYKLSEKFFEEEFQDIIDCVELIGNDLYCGHINDHAIEFIDGFIMSRSREDYLYDEETKTYYIPQKCAV